MGTDARATRHATTAVRSATVITTQGTAVDDIDLTGMTPISEVAGLTDSWWRGEDTVVAVYRGEAVAFDAPAAQTAIRYTGIREMDIYLDF